ncbi:DNA cytosine methyltransferase [Tsukamurella sputi]|uniref:DNA (cytosine-5-)-methyltransferase n=1 Tax=Tsukamurella sputi TaxID=2591848 RepID=A0A5C5RTI3_9ACTN|nr:DNA cytosine methyltransferase [Tsukamurella sputi]TWS25375.1 DNA cytosine methyltransferase [Tsukamurella sputi]
MTTALTIGSACSGAGALDLAVERVFGAAPRWFCEWEDAPSKVLAHHWPGIPNYRDLTAVDWSNVPAIDVFTAGYPCQPFSAAGKRKGTDDERHLWPFILIALNTLRPRWAVFENVAGHLTLGFDVVLADLAEHGWYVRWFVCKASDIGAPHHRKRVFILVSREPQPVPDGAREIAHYERVAHGRNPWVEPDAGLFGTIPFEDRWPAAGCIVDGVAYEVDTERAAPADVDVLPTPTVGNATGTNERRGGARGDEMLLPGVAVAAATGALLPTPTASNPNDSEDSATWEARRATLAVRHGNNGAGMPLGIAVQTLPTPTASDADKARNNPAQAARHSPPLSAVSAHFPTPIFSDAANPGPADGDRNTPQLRAIDALLPTPEAKLANSGPDYTRANLQGSGGDDLITIAARAENERGTSWGKYEPAVRRWEYVLGRRSPSPTEPNSKGRPRLAAAFAQWMMGWPEGWVTEPAIWTDDREVIEKIRAGFMPATARSAQLKIIGNGVVDRQAEHALRTMLAWRDESLVGAA